MARLGRFLTGARYFIMLGIIASLALSLAMFVAVIGRGALVIAETPAAILSAKAEKTLVVDCIELADLTFVAVALYIIAIGLFELFIAPVRMPDWLTITSLDDLKSKLVNIVVVALAVSFLGQVVTWDGVTNLLSLGVAIGAVILTLSIFGALRLGKDHDKDHDKDHANAAGASDET